MIRKKEAKEKDWSEHQPALPREARFMRTNEKELEFKLEPIHIHMNSQRDGCRKDRGPGLLKKKKKDVMLEDIQGKV